MELELRQIFGYARRWWWLLLLLPALAAATAYASSSRQPNVYKATATLTIQPSSSEGADIYMAFAGQTLAATYQELVVHEPVLAPVEAQFGPIADQVSAAAVVGTQFLRISASDTDPRRAADIANAVADQFVSFISEQERIETTASQAALQARLDEAQADLDRTTRRIRELEALAEPDAAEQAELDGQRTLREQQGASVNDLLLQMGQLEVDAALSQDQVKVSVPAVAPEGPYAPRTLFFTVFATVLGVLIAVAAVGLTRMPPRPGSSSSPIPKKSSASCLVSTKRAWPGCMG